MLTSARTTSPVATLVTAPVSEPTAWGGRAAGCCAANLPVGALAVSMIAVTSAAGVSRMQRMRRLGEEASVLPVVEPFDP